MSPWEARLQRLQRLELDRGRRPRPHLQSWHWSSQLRHPRLGIESVEWLQMNVKWGNKSFDITQQPFENFCAVFSVSIQFVGDSISVSNGKIIDLNRVTAVEISRPFRNPAFYLFALSLLIWGGNMMRMREQDLDTRAGNEPSQRLKLYNHKDN